jgi:hypothetical protein
MGVFLRVCPPDQLLPQGTPREMPTHMHIHMCAHDGRTHAAVADTGLGSGGDRQPMRWRTGWRLHRLRPCARRWRCSGRRGTLSPLRVPSPPKRLCKGASVWRGTWPLDSTRSSAGASLPTQIMTPAHAAAAPPVCKPHSVWVPHVPHTHTIAYALGSKQNDTRGFGVQIGSVWRAVVAGLPPSPRQPSAGAVVWANHAQCVSLCVCVCAAACVRACAAACVCCCLCVQGEATAHTMVSSTVNAAAQVRVSCVCE